MNTEEVGEVGAFRSLLVFVSLKAFAISILSPFDVSRTIWQVQSVPIGYEEIEAEEQQNNNNNEEINPPVFGTEGGYLKEKQTPLLPILKGQMETIDILTRKVGITSLWTGSVNELTQQVLSIFIQPTVESVLNESFDLDDVTPIELLDQVSSNLFTNISSHVITTAFLTPLQLIRTRMIVQERGKGKKYGGIIESGVTIVKEEGIWALYNGLIPNIAQTVLTRFFRTALPILIERALGLDQDSFRFILIEFILGNLELIFTLPLETIRNRLQCQTSFKINDGTPFKKLVETNKLAYTGMLDCLQKIVKEEGVFALYKGWPTHALTNFVMGLLTIVSSIQVVQEDINDYSEEN